MNCPICSVALAMTSRDGIEIDYCPQCRGVWLDRGELDKLIERAAGHGPHARDADDDDYEFSHRGGQDDRRTDTRHSQPLRKRESFWSNLFDFD